MTAESADKVSVPAPAALPEPSLAPAPVAVAAVSKPPMSYTRKVMIAVGIAASAVLLTILVYYTTHVLVLCFAGLLFAVFLSAPADLLSKYGRVGRSYALAMVLLAFAATVLGGGYFMGYTVTMQTGQLAQTLPGALVQFANDMEKRFAPPPPPPVIPPASQSATSISAGSQPMEIAVGAMGPTTTSVGDAATAPSPQPHWMADKLVQVRQATTDFFFSESFVKGAGGVTGQVVSSTFGILGDVAVVLGVGLFFAMNPKLYSQGLVTLIPTANRPRAMRILAEVGSQLQWWFVGQLCSMISIALLTFIGLSVLRIPMALTLAILAGLMNFIPNFGPLIAAAPAVLIAFAPAGDRTTLNPALAGWVILLYVVIQLLEGWVITPFFQQRAVELPAALIIISQVVFALLLGPIGLILATPILAATIVIVRMVYVEDILGDRAKAEKT